MFVKKSEIEVFILAGGKSRRMGSDKGLVNFKGEPMIIHILRALENLHLSTSIISSNEEYLKFGKPVYQDIIPNKGPLGGLYTALELSKAPMILLLACDMPSLNLEALNRLLDTALFGKIVLSTDGKNISPFFSCYPQTLKADVKNAIECNELRLLEFVTKYTYALLDLSSGDNSIILQNLNTREDLKEAEKLNKKRLKN